MKKIFLAIAAGALICMASCDNKQTSTESDDTEKTEKVEKDDKADKADAEKKDDKAAIDPFIAKLMQNDSTIKVTPSGLGYKVIKEGNGSIPAKGNTVTVNYTGKHKDGTVFDTSEGRGPANFPLTGVVPGFAEGIMLMPTGSIYELYIPGNLGYGERGTPGGPIEPNEFLIFDVELLSFE